jgi:hypothetical protein
MPCFDTFNVVAVAQGDGRSGAGESGSRRSGQGALTLIGSALVGLGWLSRRRHKVV